MYSNMYIGYNTRVLSFVLLLLGGILLITNLIKLWVSKLLNILKKVIYHIVYI